MKKIQYEVRAGRDCVRLEFFEVDEKGKEVTGRPTVSIDFNSKEGRLLSFGLLQGSLIAEDPNAPAVPPDRQKAG